MIVDNILRLAFCKPITEQFKFKCAGQRGLIRIISEIDKNFFKTITNVNDTIVFCRCDSPMKFKFVSTEPWLLNKVAFVYGCVRQ